MTIFGMTGAEIMMLQRWAQMVKISPVPVSDQNPFADLYHLREVWQGSGGTLPVTEAQVIFLKLRANG